MLWLAVVGMVAVIVFAAYRLWPLLWWLFSNERHANVFTKEIDGNRD